MKTRRHTLLILLLPTVAVLLGSDAGAGMRAERRSGSTKKPPALPPAAESPQPAEPRKIEKPELLQPRRWPVQILSATYGTGGKNADVTAKVKEHVETLRRPFSSNPRELGADPNPGWNKNLRIIYMKDGVRREQNRNENEHVLPESFYGPQDAGELKAWLPGSRWGGEQGEMQFHADGSFTSPGTQAPGRWEAAGANKLRITWPGKQPLEFVFDYVWGSFSEAQNAKSVFHLLR